MVMARHLDRAFHSLGAGIAEEHQIRKALLAQPRSQPLAVRALEQVGHVPEFCRLLLQRRHQMRMAMAERVHGDAAAEIQITLAVGPDQPDALAALERDVGPGENGEQMRLLDGGRPGADGHGGSLKVWAAPRWHSRDRIGHHVEKTKRAAFSGRHARIILRASTKLSTHQWNRWPMAKRITPPE